MRWPDPWSRHCRTRRQRRPFSTDGNRGRRRWRPWRRSRVALLAFHPWAGRCWSAMSVSSDGRRQRASPRALRSARCPGFGRARPSCPTPRSPGPEADRHLAPSSARARALLWPLRLDGRQAIDAALPVAGLGGGAPAGRSDHHRASARTKRARGCRPPGGSPERTQLALPLPPLARRGTSARHSTQCSAISRPLASAFCASSM